MPSPPVASSLVSPLGIAAPPPLQNPLSANQLSASQLSMNQLSANQLSSNQLSASQIPPNQQLPPPQQQLPQEDLQLPLITSTPSLGNENGLFTVGGMPQRIDSEMDSQIALHQEVLFQNDFVLKRTNGEQNPEADAGQQDMMEGVIPPTFAGGDDDFSISALLAGPTVGKRTGVHGVERLPEKHEYPAG